MRESFRSLLVDGITNYDMFISDLKDLVEKQDSSHGCNNLALAYLHTGQKDLAMSYFSKAIELDATNDIALHNRADAYLTSDQTDLALADYNDAVAAAPHDATRIRARAYFHKHQANYEQAIADFEVADRLQPGFPGCGNEVNAIREIMDKPIRSYIKKFIQDRLAK